MTKQSTVDTVTQAASAMADQFGAHIPEGGSVSEMADAVTSGVKQAATHLQEQGMEALVEDVVAVARRYPVQTLLLGFVCGLLLTRLRRG